MPELNFNEDGMIIDDKQKPDEYNRMNNLFRLEVFNGYCVYGIIVDADELVQVVLEEFGIEEMNKVSEWLKSTSKNEEYTSCDGNLHIINYGDVCI